MIATYEQFIASKAQWGSASGFTPLTLPDFLFDFQRAILEWAISRGRLAVFADCGLGKTPMQLVTADNITRYTDRPVLVLTPLAVAHQTVKEGEKFGIEVRRTVDGTVHQGINVTNYQRLHYYNPDDFAGVLCDESSILKSFDGATRLAVTEFMRKVQYRSLWTATAAPNDYIELGTSSEALGELGYTDMLGRFFKNDQNTIKPVLYRHRGQNFQQLEEGAKWRFKRHAELPFWRWVCSWARAIRRPSDLGFDDGRFILPDLIERDHLVKVDTAPEGKLFSVAAVGLTEQREERRRTVSERCARAADLVRDTGQPAVVWCHLNDEGDILERLIPDAVQVSGKDSDDAKESKFLAFQRGEYRVLVTKPKIGAWGLNWQHCAHMVTFPSHSFEQYYQSVRRFYRFGQTRPVEVDIVTTEGEQEVLQNLQRKAAAADKMFSMLVAEMNSAMAVDRATYGTKREEVPSWLS